VRSLHGGDTGAGRRYRDRPLFRRASALTRYLGSMRSDLVAAPFALVLVLVLAGACSSSTTSTGSPTDAGASSTSSTSSSGSAQGKCVVGNATACDVGSTCVAHSVDNVSGCERVPESDASIALGCRACTKVDDCGNAKATCVDGSCRSPLGYDFRVGTAVTADDQAIGDRCCAIGVSLTCGAPDAQGDRACKCGS
jgi:hypothetical protein